MATNFEWPGAHTNTKGGSSDPFYARENGEAYQSLDEAIEAVPEAYRRNRTVNVLGVEMWWLDDDLSSDGLVVKASAAKPSKRLWLVHAAGQAGGNGSFENPFPTIQAALNAAGSFETVLVAGGVYNEVVTLTKSVTLLALGTVQLTSLVSVGPFPQAGAGITAVLRGFTFADRMVVIRQQTSPHTVTFQDCVLSGAGFFEHYGIGTNHATVDTIRFVNQRGQFAFRFNEYFAGGQGCAVYVTDCRLSSASALFYGTSNTSSHIYLEGFTFLSNPVQNVTYNGEPWTNADWITDNRLSAGTGGDGQTPDLSNYFTKGQADDRYAQKTELNTPPPVATGREIKLTKITYQLEPLTSGTFTISTNTPVPNATAFVQLGPSCTEPTFPATIVFEKRHGAWMNGAKHSYSFFVQASGVVEYYIHAS